MTKVLRCAVYTRKSSEEGLEQDFNSLHAQREACEAYITSQRHEGWKFIPTAYDDGGYSGGNMDRPGLKQLLADIQDRKVDILVVYKVDRLTRSLADFAKIVEQFDSQGVSFVSVTQQFNTTSSMGRLTLNVLLSFAQFEREVTGERIRDKIAASKRKGIWMGGPVPLGYDVKDRKLIINEEEAARVKYIFEGYARLKSVLALQAELNQKDIRTKLTKLTDGRLRGGLPFIRSVLYRTLHNPAYIGKIIHKGNVYDGEHTGIINQELWDEVQAILKQNAARTANRVYAKHSCLLAGKVYDDKGNCMSARHGHRGDTRYRYYVSQAVIQGYRHRTGRIGNIPAYELENAVVEATLKLLKDANMLRKLSPEPAKQRAYVELGKRITSQWGSLQPVHQNSAIRNAVSRVGLYPEHVEIFYSIPALSKVIETPAIEWPSLHLRPRRTGEDNLLAFTINIKITRFKWETKMIIMPENQQALIEVNPAILKALSRAFVWNEMLVKGEIASISELATQEGVDDRYINRIIKLSLLTPQWRMALLEGKVSLNKPIDKICQEVSADWSRQVDFCAC